MIADPKSGLLLCEPWLGLWLFFYPINYSTPLTPKITFKPHSFRHSVKQAWLAFRDFVVWWKGWSIHAGTTWYCAARKCERALCWDFISDECEHQVTHWRAVSLEGDRPLRHPDLPSSVGIALMQQEAAIRPKCFQSQMIKIMQIHPWMEGNALRKTWRFYCVNTTLSCLNLQWLNASLLLSITSLPWLNFDWCCFS